MTAAPAPVPPSRPPTRGERVIDALVRVGKAYWYVVTIFIGAMLAVFLAGYISRFLPLPKAWTPQRVRDIAWIAGAVFVAIGTPLGWVRILPEGFSYRKNAPTETDSSPAPAAPDRSVAYALKSGLFMAAVGAFVGLLLGGTLAIIWFSIATGPLAPGQWLSSVRFGAGSARTSNPIPVAVWFGTMAALGALGFAFGVVGGRMGWITNTSPKQPKNAPRTPN